MKRIIILIIFSLTFSYVFSQSNKDISIVNVRNLSFGLIVPGISSTVSTTSPNAGRVYIDFKKNLTASVTFSLPNYLTSGVNNLPITFTATKSSNSTDSQLGESFNPYSGTTIQRRSTSTRDWYIRIGGVVQAPASQIAGNYNGSITIILSVIGN